MAAPEEDPQEVAADTEANAAEEEAGRWQMLRGASAEEQVDAAEQDDAGR